MYSAEIDFHFECIPPFPWSAEGYANVCMHRYRHGVPNRNCLCCKKKEHACGWWGISFEQPKKNAVSEVSMQSGCSCLCSLMLILHLMLRSLRIYSSLHPSIRLSVNQSIHPFIHPSSPPSTRLPFHFITLYLPSLAALNRLTFLTCPSSRSSIKSPRSSSSSFCTLKPPCSRTMSLRRR